MAFQPGEHNRDNVRIEGTGQEVKQVLSLIPQLSKIFVN